jgi:pimeloyl-ACP methyl ester carboxylesterase
VRPERRYRAAAVRPVVLLLTVVPASLLFAAPADAVLRFERCGGSGFACARLSVPLDRSGTVPGRVSLLVKRVRARRAAGATLPPLVVLAGGPGQSATGAFSGEALGVLHPAYARRDLIVFDQRGTGRSGLLRCRRLERANLLRAGPAAAACAASLGPRRAFYTSRESADDLEAIRAGLGAKRIALFGTSYGTKLALGYAKRYPDHVERLVLDSVVQIDGPDPFYLDSVEASRRALRSLCRRRCSWTPDPVGDVAELVDRIASMGPLRGRLVDSRGRARRRALARGDIFSTLVGGDFDPSLRAAFPGAVRAGLGGDAAPLLRLRRRALAVDAEPSPPRVLSSAVYAATTCEEVTMPWSRGTPPDPGERHRQAAARAAVIPDSAFEPFDRATALASDVLNLCQSWPQAPAAPEFGPGPLPDVPVLLVEGEDDLRTPVENARRTAALFPRSRLVIVPATGHSAIGFDFSGCAQRAFARFVQRRPVGPRCRPARRAFPPEPPPPRRLADVPRPAGTSGIRGRTLAAVKLTLRDVIEDSITALILDPSDPDIARGGGLRAGRYRIDSENTLVLDGVAFVPGVTLTGRLEHLLTRRQHGRLRIGGGAAPHGVLTVRGQQLSGRLGGRRVSGSLNAPTAAIALRAQRQSRSLVPSGKPATRTSPGPFPRSRMDATL